MANESTAQPPTPELIGVGSKELLDALVSLRDASRKLLEITVYMPDVRIQDARDRVRSAITASERLAPPVGLDTTFGASNNAAAESSAAKPSSAHGNSPSNTGNSNATFNNACI
jgi:hypothetical protein